MNSFRSTNNGDYSADAICGGYAVDCCAVPVDELPAFSSLYETGESVKCFWVGFALCALVAGCRASPQDHSAGRQNPSAVSPGATCDANAPKQPADHSRSERLPQPSVVCQPSTIAKVSSENTASAAQSPWAQERASNVRLVQAQQPGAPEALPAPSPDHADGSRRRQRIALSLSDALATSLAENPDLVAIRGTANVGAAAVDVAGVYPWNPFVQAQYLPNGRPFNPGSPGNASGQSNYYVWAMQRFELAHQRRHREDSAMAALGQIRWNIQQAELLNVAQTERLFFAALYQRQLRDLAADARVLSDRLAGVIERRFRAGLATSVQKINAQVAVRQSRRQQELADATYQTALLALRQQLGISTIEPLDLSGDLTQYEWFSVSDAACRLSGSAPYEPEVLAQQMAEARPDVFAARSAIAMSLANLNLARAARVPDIQAGPIYDTADDGTQFLGLRLQREFAVFNNGSALVNQRRTEVQQQRLSYEQIKRRAANEAAAAIDRYERARRLAVAAAQDASQTPPRELAQVLDQFEAGNTEIVDVLAVQSNLLQETRSYLDLLNEVAQSAAQVTQTTAIPPERLFAQRPPRFSEPTAP
jgi:outer membrane protein TolC